MCCGVVGDFLLDLPLKWAVKTSLVPSGRTALSHLATLRFGFCSAALATISRRRSPGHFVSPTAKSLSFFLRTRFLFRYCCSSRLDTGGPTRSPPFLVIFWPRSRRTGQFYTHY